MTASARSKAKKAPRVRKRKAAAVVALPSAVAGPLTLEAVLANPRAVFEASEQAAGLTLDVLGEDGQPRYFLGTLTPEAPPTEFRPGIDRLPTRPTHYEVMGEYFHNWERERRALCQARDGAAKRSAVSPSHRTDVHAMARLLARVCDVEREMGGASEAERVDLVRSIDAAGDALFFALSMWRQVRESTYGKPAWSGGAPDAASAEQASKRGHAGALERVVFDLVDRSESVARSLFEATGEGAHASLARTLGWVRVVIGRMQAFGPVGADLAEACKALDGAGDVLAAMVADWEKHRPAYDAREQTLTPIGG